MKSPYFFILLLIGLGCNSLKFQNDERTTEKSNKVIGKKNSSILLNSSFSDFNLFDAFEHKGNSYLLLYEKASKNIEIIDLNINKPIFHKSLNDILLNNNENGDVKSIEFVNFDSIFIFQYSEISLIDTTSLKYAFKVNDIEDSTYNNCRITNLDHVPIYFDKKTNSLSIQSYCHTCYLYKKDYYKAPIHVSYSLEGNSFNPLPIKYSNKYLNNYYGFNNIVFKSEYDDRFMIGFSADPNIYVFNKDKNRITVYGGKSNFQDLEVKPLKMKYCNDSNAKLNHLTLSPIYKEIFYDKYRDVYYRFLLNGVSEKNSDGTYNGWQDKELILMIFDSELKLIEEQSLGKGLYNSTKSFVSKKGLYLLKFNDLDSINLNKNYYDILEVF